MGRNNKGVLGASSGKVGTVIGYSIRGENFMRSAPDRKAPLTAAEMRSITQFSLVQSILTSIKEFIKIGFKDYWTRTGGNRGALSYNRQFTLKSDGTQSYIDPALFKVNGGTLSGLTDARVEIENPQSIWFI